MNNKPYNKMFSLGNKNSKPETQTETQVETQVENNQEEKGAMVICKLLNVRKEATKDSDVLCVIKNGETLVVMGKTTMGWTRVKTNSGEEGFVMSEFIREDHI